MPCYIINFRQQNRSMPGLKSGTQGIDYGNIQGNLWADAFWRGFFFRNRNHLFICFFFFPSSPIFFFIFFLTSGKKVFSQNNLSNSSEMQNLQKALTARADFVCPSCWLSTRGIQSWASAEDIILERLSFGPGHLFSQPITFLIRNPDVLCCWEVLQFFLPP